MVPALAHRPLPSHSESVTTPPVQLDAQGVPAGWSSHAPAPSQAPVVPHVAAPCVAHSASGSLPSATGPQEPSLPDPLSSAVHASHDPSQGPSQHTPSTHAPPLQSLVSKHVSPSAAAACAIRSSVDRPDPGRASLEQPTLHAKPTAATAHRSKDPIE